MAFLQFLVMLAFLQVVIFQEEGRINGPTTSTGFTAVVQSATTSACTYKD